MLDHLPTWFAYPSLLGLLAALPVLAILWLYGRRRKRLACAQLGHAVDILCDGVVIEPEAEAPSFTPHDFARGFVPADGEVLRHAGFDQLLDQHTQVRQRAV